MHVYTNTVYWLCFEEGVFIVAPVYRCVARTRGSLLSSVKSMERAQGRVLRGKDGSKSVQSEAAQFTS